MSSNRSRTRSKIRKRKHDAEMSFISILGEVYNHPNDVAQEIANQITHETISNVSKKSINASDIQDNLIQDEWEMIHSDLENNK